jgi:hypothetical protein
MWRGGNGDQRGGVSRKWKTTGVQKPIALGRSLQFFNNRLFSFLKIYLFVPFLPFFFNDAEGY